MPWTERRERQRLLARAERRRVDDHVGRDVRRPSSNATASTVTRQPLERGRHVGRRGPASRAATVIEATPARARAPARTPGPPHPRRRSTHAAPTGRSPRRSAGTARSRGRRCSLRGAGRRRQTIVFTACSRRASSDSSSIRSATAALCGIVTFAPANPRAAEPVERGEELERMDRHRHVDPVEPQRRERRVVDGRREAVRHRPPDDAHRPGGAGDPRARHRFIQGTRPCRTGTGRS